jgi:predicted ATPase
MAQVLANAARRGAHVVAETHSDLLLLAIQTLVAQGNLSPDLVKLHWFHRGKDGLTTISSADLDERGTFGDEWPIDFDEVAMGAERAYLDVAEIPKEYK